MIAKYVERLMAAGPQGATAAPAPSGTPTTASTSTTAPPSTPTHTTPTQQETQA